MIRSKEFYEDRFFSIKQAAEVLEVSSFYVRQLIADGNIAAAENRTLISKEAVFKLKRLRDRGRFHAYQVQMIRKADKQQLERWNRI